MTPLDSGLKSELTFFFDRSVGTTIPRTLQRLEMPARVERHNEHFDRDAPDDMWLPEVGAKGWTVLGYDWSYHLNQAELAAIRQYSIGVFYLWGPDARTWERVCSFAKAYDRILNAIASESRPFIFRVRQAGTLRRVL